MGRKKRTWYQNSYYHITCRGNHRNDLFRDTDDFCVYLELMGFYLKQFWETPYEVICYCLMDNHVHLLMRMSSRPLGDYMKRLNLAYAKYFNGKYNYIGHLFQDRFFAELLVTDKQLLEVSRYIHLNPVKAHMVDFPIDYKWSSYKSYITDSPYTILHQERILEYFKTDDARELYRIFVESQLKEEKNA